MDNKQKSIKEYLELICSLLIDQFNMRYEHYSSDEFKKEANERYVERDWVYKIGEPFKELAFYEVKDVKNGQSHHDICVPSKEFVMEIKYLKNWDSASKTKSASKQWSTYAKDFYWLEEEIKAGNKNKRAFVIVWCNCHDYFGQIMQLGTSRGTKNPVNKDRLIYFPFLMSKKRTGDVIYTKDLEYNYDKKFPCQLDLNILGKGNVNLDCLFLGNPNDRLHIAIYY